VSSGSGPDPAEASSSLMTAAISRGELITRRVLSLSGCFGRPIYPVS